MNKYIQRNYIITILISSFILLSSAQGSLIKEKSEKNLLKNTQQMTHYYEKRYAVFIVGYYGDAQHYRWFTRDVQRQYDLLTEKYNFSADDIYVLANLKEEWAENLSMNPGIIDYNATKTNIITVFTQLASIITENDLLYVLVINHGGDLFHLNFKRLGINFDIWQGIFAHDTFFALEKTNVTKKDDIKDSRDFEDRNNQSEVGDLIYDHDLKEYTQNIQAYRIIFILQPCYSGGFINDLSGLNHIVLTASTEAQLANGAFLDGIYLGLNGSAEDKNHDGRLSLGEIYEYAATSIYEWHRIHPNENGGRPQYPLIDDNGDKMGHRYEGILGYKPDISGKDGYVAARIYNLSYEEL